jgi:hypothetical protein
MKRRASHGTGFLTSTYLLYFGHSGEQIDLYPRSYLFVPTGLRLLGGVIYYIARLGTRIGVSPALYANIIEGSVYAYHSQA